MVKEPRTPQRWGSGQFFLVGVLVGSACGLVVGSALGMELHPERMRVLKDMVRRFTGQDDHPHYDYMV